MGSLSLLQWIFLTQELNQGLLHCRRTLYLSYQGSPKHIKMLHNVHHQFSSVAQLCLTLCNPMDSPWNSPGQNTGVGSLIPSPGSLPNPGVEPRSPALQEDSLPDEPQGKPKNTGVASLSLLQPIFLTQELNRGLLHCKQIPDQLSYQGSNRPYLSTDEDSDQ